MKIKILFFAAAREHVGNRKVEWELPEGLAAGQLKQELCCRFPAMKALMEGISVAINAEYVDDSAVLHDGDEVAIIPPVSGG
jgi:molybdopterin synthase sulfur carrier subunit